MEIQATAFEHSITGGLGGMLALSILYPLDNLRTRAQVDSDSLPTFESQQNKNAIQTTLDELLVLIKQTPSHKEVTRVIKQLPGLQAALEHQRDGLIKLSKFPGAFPEYSMNSPSTSPRMSPVNSPGGSPGSRSRSISTSRGGGRSTWELIVDVINKEGVAGFYKGLASGLVGMGAAWGTYYYFYNLLQQYALDFSGTLKVSDLSILTNLCVGTGAGTVACIVTNPLWVVNTRVKLKKGPSRGLLTELFLLFRDEGVRGAMQGVMPALVLVSNPAIQFMSAEWIKTLLCNTIMRQYTRTTLPSFIHFWVGAMSKAIATVLTYPYQVVKTRMQKANTAEDSIGKCISKVYKDDGVQGFFKGMQIKIGQTVLTSAMMFAIYDMLLKLLVHFRRPGTVKW